MKPNGWQRLWVVLSGLWMLLVGSAGAFGVWSAIREWRPNLEYSLGPYIAFWLTALIVPPAALYGLGAAIAWVSKGFRRDH